MFVCRSCIKTDCFPKTFPAGEWCSGPPLAHQLFSFYLVCFALSAYYYWTCLLSQFFFNKSHLSQTIWLQSTSDEIDFSVSKSSSSLQWRWQFHGDYFSFALFPLEVLLFRQCSYFLECDIYPLQSVPCRFHILLQEFFFNVLQKYDSEVLS